MIHDAQQRVITDIFLGDDIADRAVEQLNDEMPFVRFGVQRVWVVPVQWLRRRRLAVTMGAAKTLGANAQVDGSPHDGQMAQQSGAVRAVLLGQGRATTAAARAGERTFHGQNEFASARDLGLKDTHIRNVKRYRNERLIRHAGSSVRSDGRFGQIISHVRIRRNHYI